MFCTPLARFRLSSLQLRIRIRRQLDLDIPSCINITLGKGALRVPADAKGDFALSVFGNKSAWNALHNALRDALISFAKQAGLPAEPENDRLLDGDDGEISMARPADAFVEGQHGWKAAKGHRLWIGITPISAVCASHAALCAKEIRGGAAWAAKQKKIKYHAQMATRGWPGYLLPIAFESEGLV